MQQINEETALKYFTKQPETGNTMYYVHSKFMLSIFSLGLAVGAFTNYTQMEFSCGHYKTILMFFFIIHILEFVEQVWDAVKERDA